MQYSTENNNNPTVGDTTSYTTTAPVYTSTTSPVYTSTVGSYTTTAPVYTSTTGPYVVQNNYVEQAPTAFSEKMKLREDRFLAKEVVRSNKALTKEQTKEAKLLQKSQKHSARATNLVSRGAPTWRSSRHEEAAMKYQSQAQYHHNVATEAKQSIERAELMRSMPSRGATLPVGTTTIEQTFPGRL